MEVSTLKRLAVVCDKKLIKSREVSPVQKQKLVLLDAVGIEPTTFRNHAGEQTCKAGALPLRQAPIFNASIAIISHQF